MLSDTLQNQLQSPVCDERKRAIKALARAKDTNNLPHLEQIMRDDTDPNTRGLAQKAIAYIKQHAPQIQEPTTLITDDEPALVFNEYGVCVVSQEPLDNDFPKLSDRDRRQAEEALKRAHYAYLNGWDDRARKALKEAFLLDPNLCRNDFWLEIAEDVTGLSGNDAIRAILDFNTIAKNKKHAEKHNSENRPVVTAEDFGMVGYWEIVFHVIEAIFYVLITIIRAISLFSD